MLTTNYVTGQALPSPYLSTRQASPSDCFLLKKRKDTASVTRFSCKNNTATLLPAHFSVFTSSLYERQQHQHQHQHQHQQPIHNNHQHMHTFSNDTIKL